MSRHVEHDITWCQITVNYASSVKRVQRFHLLQVSIFNCVIWLAYYFASYVQDVAFTKTRIAIEQILEAAIRIKLLV
jgi:hypothetical protein